jgi:dihydrofolate synthase/folylpolyglutamate synthase
MNYVQCQRYLDDVQKLGIKLGLENITKLTSLLGNPHQKYPSVLVAGTNGKGSVCAMLSSVLVEHGFKVGLYTSPHLIRVEERIRIGRELIPRRDFCRLLSRLKEAIDQALASGDLDRHPTHFEILTSLAFLYFARKKVDIAVLEVGMGGRFDATNVVTPILSVITTISQDHQKFLGRRLAQIAFEKAGIIKDRVPVICGVRSPAALKAIKQRAQELAAPLIKAFDRERRFFSEKTAVGYKFTYWYDRKKYVFAPRLRGIHQGRNAALAIAAALELSKLWRKLDERKIIRGIEQAEWEGRLEVLSVKPLVLLDGAHNEEGARALRGYIRDFLSRPLVLVFAMMEDKNVRRVGRILFPLARKIILTAFPYSRAARPESIWDKLQKFHPKMAVEKDCSQALKAAVKAAGSGGCVLATGSLFLVGEIKKLSLYKR